MIMDTTKKYLYFNNDTGDTDGSVMMPVSTCVGFETTGASDVKFYFKSAPDTDTLDIQLDRTADSNPRELFEHIVNAINFSKDAVVTVGDDFTGKYIHPDITAVNNISDAADSVIKFQGHVQSNITSANPAGAGAPIRSTNVGEINSEIITTIFVDLSTTSTSAVASATADHAIGVPGTGGGGADEPAYITQVTEAVNGIVYAGELICLEAPGGASTTVGLSSSSSGTVTQGQDATGVERITEAVQAIGDRTQFNLADAANNPVHNAGIPDTRYLYLYHGSGAAGTYNAGKFLIRLYGAKTTGL